MILLEKTVLYDIHQSLNAKIAEYAGFLMPIEYAGIVIEHNAVRNDAGIFDVSHMGEIKITGLEAEKFVDYLVTNKVLGAEKNRVIYAMLVQEDGGIIDDLFVYKLAEDEILLVVNAANIEKDYKWIIEHKDNYKVNIKNVSDIWGEVALQGPKSSMIFEEYTKLSTNDFKFMTYKKMLINGKEFIVSRSGYTGEDGFEIYGKNADIKRIFEDLVYKYNVVPCGLGSRDTLRFEASLPLYGHEMSTTINPFEAGMGFAVKLDKEDFIGKKALLKVKEEGLKRKLIGIELIEKNIPRAGYLLYKDDVCIGEVTTGYLSISLDKPIALGLIRADCANIDSEIYVAIRKKMVKAKIISRQFYQKNYKR
ncbi:MAG: glycine cleavage system aminomethyltransferase GcvT [Bacilli bacterium]|nr:glycine cleavage system aminomethyltransferase GcvT [Bacilli bacterium]